MVKRTKTILFMLIIITYSCTTNISSIKASSIIFIRTDGSIEGTNKIYRNENVYTFTDNIIDSYGIVVEKNNIIIDGKGYTIQAAPRILPEGSWDFGIELSNVTYGEIVVKSLKIVDFNIGIYVGSANNTITGNTIIGSNVGILIAESPNVIVANYIGDNMEGIFLGPLPQNHASVYNVFYHNSFVNNTRNVYDCECSDPSWIQHLNIWDNGTCGNYWSDYNEIDGDENGIGDTPYPVTEDDVDLFPLMFPLASPSKGKDSFLGTNIPWECALGLIFTLIGGTSIILYILLKSNRLKR